MKETAVLKPFQSKYDLRQLFPNLKPYLQEGSPFSQTPLQQNWQQDVMDQLGAFQMLVVGAGGLGCEIVKNLAVSGVRKIHLIDMDTIDLTNLNRQFLFRQKDIGRPKAEVVAEFVMRRCPGVEVIPRIGRVQELSYQFYSKFSIIVAGLDNIEARKFLNTMVHQVNEDQEDTVCFYIDGATEGFDGQCLVVEPFKSSCYNCSLLDGLAEKPKANYCTIANTPRTPEHCVQYVLELEWVKQFPTVKRDNDNLAHMKWVYEKSVERAKQFNIQGVTEMLTMGVTKNIIPAIASTNALIAGFCTNEAIKIAFNTNKKLVNYYLYKGSTSTGSESYEFARKDGCKACHMRENRTACINLAVPADTKFADLLKLICKQNLLLTPYANVYVGERDIYNPFDKARKDAKDAKTLAEMYSEGTFKDNPQLLVLTDGNLKIGQQEVLITVQPPQSTDQLQPQ